MKISFNLFAFLRPHPARDWMIIFTIAFIIWLLLTAYAGYLFLGIRSGSIIETNTEGEPAVVLTKEKIDAVLSAYHIRKDDFESGRALPALPDPGR